MIALGIDWCAIGVEDAQKFNGGGEHLPEGQKRIQHSRQTTACPEKWVSRSETVVFQGDTKQVQMPEASSMLAGMRFTKMPQCGQLGMARSIKICLTASASEAWCCL